MPFTQFSTSLRTNCKKRVEDWAAKHLATEMPDQIVEAEGVQKEDSDDTLSSPEDTVAADTSPERESVNPEPSTVGKRKRGRPRKSDSDEATTGAPPTPAPPTDVSPAPLALPAPPPPPESSSTSRRKRGRPKKAFKVKLMQFPPRVVHSVGSSFKPYMLNVPFGRDIIQELLAYVQEDSKTVVPLTATGYISSVTFYSSDPGGEKTTHEGQFVINVLQGSLNRKYGLLSLWMTDEEGQHIGGCIGGPLIAGNQVQIIFGQFEDMVERRHTRKQQSANASAAAAAQTENDVDDGDLVDVPVHAAEMVEGNANGSSPGPEGSDEEEPIMASPITIVPPASSHSEGSDEEELIMASPITIVPPASSHLDGSDEGEPIMASPASSLSEGSDEEEPIMASPTTIVPPASSHPEGSDEGELIMASPASSVPEGSDEGEPIMASPTTNVPPALSHPEGSDEGELIMASPTSSLPKGSDKEEPITASPITTVPPASSLPETPEDQNESMDICGSDPEKRSSSPGE